MARLRNRMTHGIYPPGIPRGPQFIFGNDTPYSTKKNIVKKKPQLNRLSAESNDFSLFCRQSFVVSISQFSSSVAVRHSVGNARWISRKQRENSGYMLQVTGTRVPGGQCAVSLSEKMISIPYCCVIGWLPHS